MKTAEEILDKHAISHDRGRGMVIMADTFKISVINAMNEYGRQCAQKAPQEVVVEKTENLIRLTEMSGDHFEQIFQANGFAPSFVKEIISRFSSLYGFHDAIGKYGYFDSHRKAVRLGYDVEFTLDQPQS